MLILTAVIGQTWDHDPSADPVLQGQRSRQGGRLQVLRVGLRKLREAGVCKRRVLTPERGQGVHGCRIQAGNWGQSWVREVQNAGFRDYSCLKLRGPRGRGVRTATGDRAARRTVAAEVSTPPVILICEQSIDSEVSWVLHRCLSRSKTNKQKNPRKQTDLELCGRAPVPCVTAEVAFTNSCVFPVLLQRFRKVDSADVPLSPSKKLQIIHVSHFSARPG